MCVCMCVCVYIYICRISQPIQCPTTIRRQKRIQNFYKDTSRKAPTLKALKEGKDTTKINCMEITVFFDR